MSRHDLLLLGSSLDTHSESIMDFCLEDCRNTLVMSTFNEQGESCWVKMNCCSHFPAQTVLGELLGTKLHVLVKKKFQILWKERAPFQKVWDRRTVRKKYVANIRKPTQGKPSTLCSIHHPELKGVPF